MGRLLLAFGLLALSAAPAGAGAVMRPVPPPPPVVLVHGIDDTDAIFNPMRHQLAAAGRTEVYGLDMIPNNGDLSLRELAGQVSQRVAAVCGRCHTEQVDLVGFSMGALVSRYYLQKLGGVQHVRRFVAIAAPHRGTVSAYFRWNAGAAEMRPYSPFLAELDASVDVLSRIEVHTVWTPFDLMIFPAVSSRLPGAVERVVPVLGHPLMVRDERAVQAVVEALK